MAIDTWSTGTLRGRVVSLDGQLIKGSVKIEILASQSYPYLTNTKIDAMIPVGLFKSVDLVTGDGNDPEVQSFKLEVPATDDDDVREKGWAVRVTLALSNAAKPVIWTFKEIRTGQVIDVPLALPDTIVTDVVTSRSLVLDNIVQIDPSTKQLKDGKGNVIASTASGNMTAVPFAIADNAPTVQEV